MDSATENITPEEQLAEEKKRRDKRFWEIMLVISSFLMCCSMFSFAYAVGAIVGPKGVIPSNVVHETDNYTLSYYQGAEAELDHGQVVREIEQSLKDVQRIWNSSTNGSIRISVSYFIYDAASAFSSHDDGLHGYAVACELPWAYVVEFSTEGCNPATMRHEFTHILCAMHDIDHQFGYNEGLARYAERDDGWYDEGFELLLEHGPASSLELPSETLTGNDYATEYLRRVATGWCQVYYLCRIKDMPPDEVLKLTEYPDPVEAFNAVRTAGGI